MVKHILGLLLFFFSIILQAQNNVVRVKPTEYDGALRNPLKGFTTINVQEHPWGTLSHTYIRWNELENHESDGIEKIIKVSNEKWKNAASKNIKVIPRVYLHWDGDKKYWPADMQEDDYTSAQFQSRVLRLIKRLGICWDNDPRVAFVEMGIFGKWGEQHSPFPTAEMEIKVGDAFAKAFKNKKVSVRRNWERFTLHPFGEYWDSWAHYDQMWGHGNSIKVLNDQNGRYKETYIGGEVAYNWGNSDIQPGPSPTQSVAVKKHRDFVINSIRWLHCTQLRWISAYDKYNTEAIKGAEEMQKAFGYRYVFDEVRFSFDDSLEIAFDITNTGSAPFYYNWPVEVALLDSTSHEPVWSATLDSVDIRDWLPGEKWTDPEWKYVGSWQEYHPNVDWNPSKPSEWETPPVLNSIENKFKVDLPDGTYILSLSILDPAGDMPSIKFATNHYIKGGRHPLGLVYVGENKCDTLPSNFNFDDPKTDNGLYYDDDFEIVYEKEPEQTPFKESSWIFPSDTVLAWQYDFMNNFKDERYFSLDSGNTIGVYGCNDTTGLNVRVYQDSIQNIDAAQYKWNQTNETFQKNGQWIEFSSGFKLNQPYQLLLKARNNANANFKLTILRAEGDTAFFYDFNIQNDFTNKGGGNEQTDWYLSKIPLTGLWGNYIIKFDWYDNIGEPGIFGAFTFVQSEIDATPPEWYYVSIGNVNVGSNLVVMTTEDARVYLVPDGTSGDIISILASAVSEVDVIAYAQATISTTGLFAGDYVVYAIDNSNNISEASKTITLQYPVNTKNYSNDSEISVYYNSAHRLIGIRSSNELNQIEIYNILGKKMKHSNCFGRAFDISISEFNDGIYFVRVQDKKGNIKRTKILVNKN